MSAVPAPRCNPSRRSGPAPAAASYPLEVLVPGPAPLVKLLPGLLDFFQRPLVVTARMTQSGTGAPASRSKPSGLREDPMQFQAPVNWRAWQTQGNLRRG